MSVTSRYREAWEAFWSAAPAESGAVIWDAEPALAAARHLALFAPHLGSGERPLVDLGCGNGTQTRYLAGRFRRVIGVDLSAAAIEHARRADPAGRAEFRRLDAVEADAAGLLHTELGDADVYMRGVLHQCDPADRQPLADAIATLTGERGRAFLVELSEAAGPVLRGLAGSAGGPPPKLAPVFAHGLTPADVVDDAVPRHLAAAGLAVLAEGELPLVTTESAADGSRIELPARWLVVGRSG
ncbi:class I SAM-dependent methyltransferase [Streptomyces alfalfae]|uniref:Methyltransferase n=1 Tax=Streptomyces alfalfae TaxID=1642299 RepID=A0ABM6GNK6_9ACTN|nr:class I SAM-dependent methyltransferase [Streptomyces alfalfae]APY85410.1 methyltransferase [Streptomyces alfalfae]AYA15761.1 class I SAM-dependent methyltransferase [Streptomyces fradiae]RXX39238.1 class I SAM-dependent methyltransferase [Streptomyces alfalfae]RZM98077.1 class I SAM-dependent methyltransferase [Streptomyces alfalfae]